MKWKRSSNMPDVYISGAGVDSKHFDEKFAQSELVVLKQEFEKKEHDDKLKQERLLEMEEKLAVMERRFEEIAEVLRLRTTVGQLT